MIVADPAPIAATDAAREAIATLRAARGGSFMFVQSGGCCGGSVPQCLPDGELIVGDHDVLLGVVDDCPFYIDDRLDEAWGRPSLVLDVAPGHAEGFSLGAGDGTRFVTLPSADVPT